MVKRSALWAIITMSLVTLLAVVVACGDDDNRRGMGGGMMATGTAVSGMMNGNAAQPGGSVRVDLSNWAVEPDPSSAKAGKVTFWAVHDMGHMHTADEGGITHDLQVMKKSADGSFELVGQIQGLTMGQAKALTLVLTPGEYELSCNVVEQIGGNTISHYKKGMHTAFTVH